MSLFGIDSASDRLRLRALRAAPPSRARSAERKAVFAAALGQFDELLTAAEVVGPASAPLPLYYALNQAGRAIAAARETDALRWQPRGHGLKVDDPSSPLQATVIKPEPPPKRRRPRDMFSVVCDCVGSAPLRSPVQLGALWAAAPRTEVVRGLGRGYTRAAPLEPSGGSPPVMAEFAGSEIARLPKRRRTDVARERMERAFPAVRDGVDVRLEMRPGPDGRPMFVAELSRQAASGAWFGVEHFAPRFPDGGAFFLMPGLGASEDVLSPLMVWWALLYALSHLARYQPAAWAKALDPTRSVLAVPIEAGLAYIAEVLPQVILAELTR